MGTSKWFGVVPLAAVAAIASGVSLAYAEPLTPLKPNEIQYLDQLHKVFAVSYNPKAFRSDGELLTDGYFACAKRNVGHVGQEDTFQPPAINQLAFIYLCP